ncbi:YbaB/EbfC family nucleoid-associated protein [Actinoplanes sp. KI2]|uniref:YbaB/EbfC family nucleoid-associated protein n=1 Tax=Actinoplanes sp. KI2 TaxID=2983315 RepID=UPI0021D5AE17|nr:YbaB/EbfC family nucleoid-associated protein [Actinoplanes sp. KI2]MCU7725291.1 YbaB/EbfC family nucleoid-associated protein [Actinoplanes sp. KI2]
MAPDTEDVLGSFEARVEAQTRLSLQLSAELEAAEVTLRSPNGEVTVRVDSAGGLSDLRFHPEAEAVSREELARIVLATSRQAQAKLADRVGELVSSIYGSDSSTAAFVTDAYTSRYPHAEDEPEVR